MKPEVENLSIFFKVSPNLESSISSMSELELIELNEIVEHEPLFDNGNNTSALDLNCSNSESRNFIVYSEKTLREYNIEIITNYLLKYNLNVVKVAEKLDIGKSTIYNMIKSGEITLNK